MEAADYNECRQDLIRAIREQLFRNIWIHAAFHQEGMGLQGGPDLTVLRKHLRTLNKQGENAKAGMLMCIASGGNWSQSRKHAAGWSIHLYAHIVEMGSKMRPIDTGCALNIATPQQVSSTGPVA